MTVTIKDDWESYQRDVLPINAPQVQVQECRRAFYAGALAASCNIRDSGDLSSAEKYAQECMAFKEEVTKGDA